MTKTLLETVNLTKNFDHKNGNIELFKNVNEVVATPSRVTTTWA